MIGTARERIAKFREAEKMVGARGGAERQPWRQRERGASRTHLKDAAGTLSVGRHAWHGTLNLLLMKTKNHMSDSLLLWE